MNVQERYLERKELWGFSSASSPVGSRKELKLGAQFGHQGLSKCCVLKRLISKSNFRFRLCQLHKSQQFHFGQVLFMIQA